MYRFRQRIQLCVHPHLLQIVLTKLPIHYPLAQEQFLAKISHELRTPMNAIIGLTYLALQTNLDSRQNDYLTKINAAAKGLLTIINDILDYGQIFHRFFHRC